MSSEKFMSAEGVSMALVELKTLHAFPMLLPLSRPVLSIDRIPNEQTVFFTPRKI